ncbi:MAG TPA: nicotinate-nucleotide--dimethylbenzimidazole phosphoribosyltransferase [Candidatus Limnocylindrales bacterium]|nr:nicotinate-nucleotide--dimethylbenzimidazole phosphoribosyltransferase [Candidatus Limnocylindrales bacterium]
MTTLDEALAAIEPLDEAAMAAARDRLDHLTKPPGSLGRLEELAIWMAGLTGHPAASVAHRRIVIAAADHGVAMNQPVSAWPSDVTQQMVSTFLGGRAAISQLAKTVDASIEVIDIGVAGPTRHVMGSAKGTRFVARRIRPGTSDMTEGPVMTRAEADQAIAVGLEAVDRAIADGVELLGVGEMGIGNTTAASAIVAALTRLPPGDVTGRGTGVDDEGLTRKVAAIERAIAVNRPDAGDPVGVLAAVGGFEIAVLVGVIVGAAARRVPLILDGFITGAAALVATGLEPLIAGRLVAAHRSVEPGHAIVLDRLDLRPLLDLDLRLGEGTGAALAMSVFSAAVAIRDGMATFEEAAVSDRR